MESEELGAALGSKAIRGILGFIPAVIEIGIALFARVSGLVLLVAIGLGVVLLAIAVQFAGFDKNIARPARNACHRCTGYLHGTLAYTFVLLSVIGVGDAPAPGTENMAVPFVLFAVGGILIATMAWHGYRHRVKGMPRHVRTSWLTGFIAAFLAAFALAYGLLILF